MSKLTKISKCRWLTDDGATILKYRLFPGTYAYLRYEAGEPLECGNYSSFISLKAAQQKQERTA